MRVRAQDASGDYTFGQSSANFLVDSPAAVAQLVQTRLLLVAGEWFLDTSAGTPYSTEILGPHRQSLYDQAIRQVVLRTPNVSGIADYASILDPATRALSVRMTIDTSFGTTEVQVSL